jgi:signal peptidase I
VVVSALVLSLILKTFFIQSFWIPSSSMENTLQEGDRILVTKWRPGPLELRRGDVVVFKDPGGWLNGVVQPEPTGLAKISNDALTFTGLLPEDSGEHLVKRVVGLPGDTVVCCDTDGYVTVNSERIVEPYLKPGVDPSTTEFSIVVPAGYLWVMGDNRPNSADSRAHRGDPGGGAIPLDNVVGTAFVTVWPLENWRGLGNPFEDQPDED